MKEEKKAGMRDPPFPSSFKVVLQVNAFFVMVCRLYDTIVLTKMTPLKRLA